MARYDDLNTKMIAYAAVLSIVVLVIILQGTQALCYNMVSAEDSRKVTKNPTKADLAKREQIDSLAGYKKVKVIDENAPSPKKGEEAATKEILQIPIEAAEKLILKEFAKAPAPTPGT